MYRVLMFIGKELGDLMSSSCPCKRIGRLLYRNKCDPYVMLSHVLGATKTTCNMKSEAGAVSVQQVGNSKCYSRSICYNIIVHCFNLYR